MSDNHAADFDPAATFRRLFDHLSREEARSLLAWIESGEANTDLVPEMLEARLAKADRRPGSYGGD